MYANHQAYQISFPLDESIFIGFTTKSCIRKRVEDGDISLAQVKTFYESVQTFYERAWQYALENLPLHC